MRKFLISRLSSMGDVICTLPVASALKTLGDDVEVTWVVDPRFAAPVHCCSAVDRVFEANPHLKPKSWRLTEDDFECALDLQGLMKSALFVAGAKTMQRIGFHWQREGSGLMVSKVLPDPTSLHVVDQYVDVARYLGATTDRAEFALQPKPEDVEKWSSKLADNGPFVILNAGAGWAVKRWPPSHFAEIARRLHDRGLAAIFIGSKASADREAFQAVVDAGAPNAHSLLGQTSIRELIAVVSLAQAHVGGDTGSTHLSAALGIPAIGLYSNNRPERTCPYGQRHRTHYHPAGLAHIQPEEVWETLAEAVQK